MCGGCVRGRRLSEVKGIAGVAALKKTGKEGGAIGDCDMTDVLTIMYIAEIKGMKEAMKELSKVERCEIDQFVECYETFVELGATEEECKQLKEKATSFYPFFEEYLACVGY